MSIQGSLRSLTIPDLFSLLSQLGKTGVLSVVSETKERGFLFLKGQLAYATTQEKSRRLGYYLQRLGYVSEEQLEMVFGAGFGRETYFGKRLVENGLVTSENLAEAVKAQIVDILNEVILWDTGAFYFDDTTIPFEVPDSELVSCQSILLDVARTADEREMVARLLPDRSVIYTVERSVDPMLLSENEGVIFCLVNGRRSVDEVLNDSELEPGSAATALSALIDKGVLGAIAGSGGGEAHSPRDIAALPVTPWTASQLFSIFDSRRETNDLEREVCDVIKSDPLLAAKVLKMLSLTNVEAGRNDISIERMVKIQGLFQIRCSLLPEAVRGYFFPDQGAWEDLWKHSVHCALLCQKIAEVINYPNPGEAYLAGLTHNLGAFLLFFDDPAGYARLINQSMLERTPIQDLERSELGFTHTEIGGDYSERWRFPASVRLAIRNHHDATPGFHNRLSTVLGLALLLLADLRFRVGFQDYKDAITDPLLMRVGVSRVRADGLVREVRRECDSQLPRRPRRILEPRAALVR